MLMKNYFMMPIVYIIVSSNIKSKKASVLLVLAMNFSLFMVDQNIYHIFGPRSGGGFHEERRSGGVFEAAGLGPNHLAAFVAMFGIMALALALFEKHKLRKKIFWGVAIFSIYPVLFTFSRGAYAGYVLGLLFLGTLRARWILVLLLVSILSWQVILPSSVRERISMTQTESGQLESSSQHRIDLWNYAYDIYQSNIVFGTGTSTFRMYEPSTGGYWKDTHNYFLLLLTEMGTIIYMFLRIFLSGMRLYRKSNDPFYQGLGIGLSSCILTSMMCNMFGNRWAYFVLGSFLWVYWGIVDSAVYRIENPEKGKQNKVELKIYDHPIIKRFIN